MDSFSRKQVWLPYDWQVANMACLQALSQIQSGYPPHLHPINQIQSLLAKENQEIATNVMPNLRLQNNSPKFNGWHHDRLVLSKFWILINPALEAFEHLQKRLESLSGLDVFSLEQYEKKNFMLQICFQKRLEFGISRDHQSKSLRIEEIQ